MTLEVFHLLKMKVFCVSPAVTQSIKTMIIVLLLLPILSLLTSSQTLNLLIFSNMFYFLLVNHDDAEGTG